jgi:hypothetical protein
VKGNWSIRRTLLALAFGLLLMASLPAFSQSCALCYTQAASAGARMIQALRSGILILIVPPMLMTVGFFRMAYRRRHKFTHPPDEEHSNREW